MEEKVSAKAILSMIFGIVSLGGGIIFSILALVFAKSGNVNAKCSGFCKAGKITGIIGLVTGTLLIILIIVGAASGANTVSYYRYY